MNNKAILLSQTGLALIFLLSGPGVAMAQPAASAPAVSIDAPVPTAPVAAAPAAPAAAPATPVTSINEPAPTPTATAPAAVTPVAEQTLPPATKTETASQPPAAELSVAKPDATPATATAAAASAAPAPAAAEPATPEKKQAKKAAHQDDGLKVTDILSTPANVRPLPGKYLVVKKVRNANDADARLTAARSALAQGNYQASLEIFDDLYRKNPRDMRVIMGRAVALQKLGQIDEAMDAYQVALRTDPRNIEALTNMLGLLKGRDTPTALKKLQQLRDLYPANAELTAQLGMVYGVSGDYNNALKYLDMADALKPGSPIVLYNKAVAYDRMGRTAEAAGLYHQILLLASDGVLDQSFPLEVVRQRLATLR